MVYITEKEVYDKHGLVIVSWYDAKHYDIPIQYAIALKTTNLEEAIAMKETFDALTKQGDI